MQYLLEKKLMMRSSDKDMVVMLHEIEYKLQGKTHKVDSLLIVTGEDNVDTAMAKTVGLPLGIAACNILLGKIALTGLHIPILPDFYDPVLAELELYGIRFDEKVSLIA
jgi:saccharopine dehydrogenase (NADP+, L-glutamate forming)